MDGLGNLPPPTLAEPSLDDLDEQLLGIQKKFDAELGKAAVEGEQRLAALEDTGQMSCCG